MIWGAAIAVAGLPRSIVLAAVLLAVAGAADCISAVCRTTIAQLVTTEAMRGRMTSVFGLVVTGGVRLGDIESGTVAALTSPRFAVVSGGLACIAGVGVVLIAFPGLARFDAQRAHGGARSPAVATQPPRSDIASGPRVSGPDSSVTIIGASGALGFGLAVRLAAAGVEVTIGSRDAERAARERRERVLEPRSPAPPSTGSRTPPRPPRTSSWC